jgi:hypothetical protein
LPTGDLIVGGLFSTAGGVAGRNNIARFRADINAWTTLGSGTDSVVSSLALLPDGDVLAGGRFALVGGNTVSVALARYSFETPAPSIVSQPASRVACASAATSFAVAASGGGALMYQWRRGGVALDVAANPSAATATLMLADVQPVDAGVYDCVITSACGSVTSNPATLNVVQCCGPSDVAGPNQALAPDGVLTADDIIVYLNWFFASDLRADVGGANQSTTPDGTVTADDICVFLNRYFQGC